MRPDKDTYYLDMAKAVSKRSTCLRRQYGAVIVNNDVVVSTGYNGGVRGGVNCCDVGECQRQHLPHNSGDYGQCHAVHAEQNAIISPSRAEMIGSTLYLYGCENGCDIEDVEPCPICRKMICNAGIAKLVTKAGCVNINNLFKEDIERCQ
jgi:dCMP deaminase